MLKIFSATNAGVEVWSEQGQKKSVLLAHVNTGGLIVYCREYTQPILSQLWSFKIRRTTFPNNKKFVDLLILRL